MTSYFETLPSELIYKIFGYLESRTIVRSLRCVCRRLYELVNAYDEYDFNFQSISKRDMIFVCNSIELDHVQSLILSHDKQTPGQIEYFLSHYCLKYFTELRSLTLIEIDNCYLNIILKDIQQLKLLNSLKIETIRDDAQSETEQNLTRVLMLPTLQEFVCISCRNDFNQFSWPSQSIIRSLVINCQRLDQLYDIVRYLPNLQNLSLQQLFWTIHNNIQPKPDDLQSFHQLKSFKLQASQRPMYQNQENRQEKIHKKSGNYKITFYVIIYDKIYIKFNEAPLFS